MFRRVLNRRGQIVGEYAIALVIIIGTLTMMSVFIRRTLQGRIHDAGVLMTSQANEASWFAFGSDSPAIVDEYEPYYTDTTSNISREESEDVRLFRTPSLAERQQNPGVRFKDFERKSSSRVSAQTRSLQLPPSSE